MARHPLVAVVYGIPGWWPLVRAIGRLEAPLEDVWFGQPTAEMLDKGKALFPGHVLYYFRASPYALKVRLALNKLGVAIEMKDILEDAVAQAELIEHGRRDQVPCLKIPGNGAPDRWLYESSEIVKYLREKAGARP